MLLLLCVITISVSAQFKKNTLLIETNFGNLRFGKEKRESEASGVTTKTNDKFSVINFFPRVGFFINNNFVLGTELNFSYSNATSESLSTTNIKTNEITSVVSSFGLAPFLRYYFNAPKDSWVRFYIQLAGGVSTEIKNKYESKAYNATGQQVVSTFRYDFPKKYVGYNGSILLGYNNMIAKNTALNLNLGYKYSGYNYDRGFTTFNAAGVPTQGPVTKYLATGGSIEWGMGITVFIPRTKKTKKK
jgi:hypothetical protein